MDISQNFVAFSEYMKFNKELHLFNKIMKFLTKQIVFAKLTKIVSLIGEFKKRQNKNDNTVVVLGNRGSKKT